MQWLSRKLEPHRRHIMPINNYMLATEPLSEELRVALSATTSISDSRFVINYWKLSADNRLLFGGGILQQSIPADLKGFVRKYMLRVYPELADTRIDYGWGGTWPLPSSACPISGSRPTHFTPTAVPATACPLRRSPANCWRKSSAAPPSASMSWPAYLPAAFPAAPLRLRWPGLVAACCFTSSGTVSADRRNPPRGARCRNPGYRSLIQPGDSLQNAPTAWTGLLILDCPRDTENPGNTPTGRLASQLRCRQLGPELLDLLALQPADVNYADAACRDFALKAPRHLSGGCGSAIPPIRCCYRCWPGEEMRVTAGSGEDPVGRLAPPIHKGNYS